MLSPLISQQSDQTVLVCARPTKVPLPLSLHHFGGVAEAALDCAHRTSTASSCAFCEQGGHLATPSSSRAVVFPMRKVYKCNPSYYLDKVSWSLLPTEEVEHEKNPCNRRVARARC